MFEQLEEINTPPEPFEFYTAGDLWTDEHTSKQMLKFHLDGETDASSRNAAFIEHSVDWITSRFNVGGGKKVADFGCGPGLYTVRLARRHAEVTGIDFSKRSIQYAREVAAREGLSIQYINRNYLDFDTNNRFHLIMMIMCDFCALSPGQRRTMLANFHMLLEPGGSVLLDVYSLTAFGEREEKAVFEADLLNGFWSPNKYYGFLNTFKYEKEKVVLDKYTLIEAGRTRTIYNWFQHFSPEDLEIEFEQCGFAVEDFYSDVAGTPFTPVSKEFAVVAKKL
ncbi:MAG: Ubiquinone biosynthesis O-methyltransferase [Syntrophorhabdus sp. PtaU1.Bin002]|nr:MAG: Ubiquinone biosynthesis O-methyltransferase [Syntrophorhabdus sp. PtaU1.Bin002]